MLPVDNRFHLFNTRTMSGVHPGSRTAQSYFVHLQSVNGDENVEIWSRLLGGGSEDGYALYAQAGDGWSEQPLAQIPGGMDEDFFDRLREALAVAGHRPLTCGGCRWWSRVQQTANPEGLPLGLCRQGGMDEGSPNLRYAQSALALECPHWQEGLQEDELPPFPSAQAAQTTAPTGWWTGLRNRLTGKGKTARPQPAPDALVERSGVGAGTERCLACHGRIANLGALTLATASDDRRTVSIWRCRLCHSFYLNDWIDRWERLDSLETEESYYRLAPKEAFDLLALFGETSGGEHPKDRHSRTSQRDRVDAFLTDRPRLLHQFRQGR